MLRSALGKVVWLVRGLALFGGAVVGLALVVGLTVGAASVALGADGNPLLLGRSNVASALTKLTANRNGPATQITNTGNGTDATALDLRVASGKPPMEVNSTAKVTNLNSDRVDGKNPADLVPGGNVPAGTTIRGAYEIDGYASAAGQLVGGDSISFGYALPSTPSAVLVAAGSTPPAQCPGTANFPQARPGYLCVYEGGSINRRSGDPVVYTVTTVGAGMFMNSAGVGSSYSSGTWAVRVPSAAQAAKLPSRKRSNATADRYPNP